MPSSIFDPKKKKPASPKKKKAADPWKKLRGVTSKKKVYKKKTSMKKKTKDLKFDPSTGKPIVDRFGGLLLKDKFQPKGGIRIRTQKEQDALIKSNDEKKRKKRFKKDKSGDSSITDI